MINLHIERGKGQKYNVICWQAVIQKKNLANGGGWAAETKGKRALTVETERRLKRINDTKVLTLTAVKRKPTTLTQGNPTTTFQQNTVEPG